MIVMIDSILSGKVIGKQMQFFSLLVTPFLVLFRFNPVGIYILNTGLVLLAIVAVDYIIKYIFSELDDFAAAAVSFTFGMFAFIYTGITYVNPDFYSAVFLPILIYCYLKKYYLFFLYSSIVFCGMKANMLATYCVLFFVILTASLIRKKKINKELVIETIIIAIPLLINVFLKFVRTVQGWSQQSTRPVIPLIPEIKARLSQEFIYGFKWLILALAILAILFRLRKLKRYPVLLLAIPLSSIVQIGVYVYLHKTKLSICPRYWAIDALMYAVGFGLVLDSIPIKKIRVFLLSVITCLITIQQFYTIDPAMLFLCKKIPFEKRNVRFNSQVVRPRAFYQHARHFLGKA